MLEKEEGEEMKAGSTFSLQASPVAAQPWDEGDSALRRRTALCKIVSVGESCALVSLIEM